MFLIVFIGGDALISEKVYFLPFRHTFLLTHWHNVTKTAPTHPLDWAVSFGIERTEKKSGRMKDWRFTKSGV